jgi:hypothetical protein
MTDIRLPVHEGSLWKWLLGALKLGLLRSQPRRSAEQSALHPLSVGLPSFRPLVKKATTRGAKVGSWVM